MVDFSGHDKKSNVKYRFCLNFRQVNKVAKGNTYPLPHIVGILDKLNKAKYLSTNDLSQTYHQISLEKSSKEITAFRVSGRSLFKFKRLSYGLSGGISDI